MKAFLIAYPYSYATKKKLYVYSKSLLLLSYYCKL